jgi:hypothetical protein
MKLRKCPGTHAPTHKMRLHHFLGSNAHRACRKTSIVTLKQKKKPETSRFKTTNYMKHTASSETDFRSACQKIPRVS